MTTLPLVTVSCVAAWLGIMGFFSFVAAPVLFRTLERSAAGDAAAAVLPGYYAVGLALCGGAFVALIVRLGRREPRWLGNVVSAAITAGMIVMLFWSLTVIVPTANAARRARDDGRFVAAHRRAVILNLATMLGGIMVLVVEAVTPRRDPPPARPSAS